MEERKKKDMIHIVFSTDANYVMPTGVAMISICENNRAENICFHLLVTMQKSVGEGDCLLPALFEIANKYGHQYIEYPVNASLLRRFGNSSIGHITISTFSRLFIADLLSHDIHRVLYFDGDIVVNNSLVELWSFGLENNIIGAVEDANGSSGVYHRTVHTPMSDYYFNAGVLLIDLDKWRIDNVTNKCLKCAEEHLLEFGMMDQDILNFVLHDKVSILPIKYNFQTIFIFNPSQYWMVSPQSVKEVECIVTGKDNASIIHYIAANKPWKDEWCPLREIWEKYEAISSWKGQGRYPVITRFDRSEIYNDFIDAYWSDSELFKKSLYPFINLFKIAVRMKNKSLFMKIGVLPLSSLAIVLGKIYSFKTRK